MMVSEKKYKALRVIATIYKIFAFIAAGLCIIVALVMLVAGIGSGMATSSRDTFGVQSLGVFRGFLGAVVMFFYGAVLFVVLYGAGEFIYVFLDIGENTRLTNHVLSTRA